MGKEILELVTAKVFTNLIKTTNLFIEAAVRAISKKEPC